MKKILMLCGSPRKQGNSSTMADILGKSLSGNGNEVTKIRLYDFEIKPCVDCRACKKNDLVCILNDGMVSLYPQIDTADVLIFATPIYWYCPTAVTKLMLDRFRPYFTNKKLNGKKAALLLPAGSGPGDCGLTIEIFTKIFDALGIVLIGAVTAEAYNVDDVNRDDDIKSQVRQLGEKILTQLQSV